MPVAVAVHAVLEDVLGQHLHHADLARPGACGAVRVEIPARVELDRGEDLRPEDLGPAAVVRERHQRVGGVEIALDGAVVGLEGPEGQQHAPRDAVVALDPVEDLVVALGHLAAPVQPVLADELARELDEGRLEEALPPVALQHLAVLPDPVKEGLRDRRVVPAIHRLGAQIGDEGAEVAPAGNLLRLGGAGKAQRKKEGADAHGNLVAKSIARTLSARETGASSGAPPTFPICSHFLRGN
ncbi:hypothetical protein Salmuc_03012 [Salipiger mucosus DSM 16094]|uniref:Uncharacterized protein n=1 Tax=Salipiger mucosus DSM 16094 TaxID=1123237 RepID=S9R549_9RHOB|nr:hypothetical protein Salmuc_03012 [Salipiger mucosus DSM 16094]